MRLIIQETMKTSPPVSKPVGGGAGFGKPKMGGGIGAFGKPKMGGGIARTGAKPLGGTNSKLADSSA